VTLNENAGTPIVVDVWSDVACPWCYIGKRRLEAGMAQFAQQADAPPIEVVFHSYELSPDTPVDFDGTEIEFLEKHKGLTPAQVAPMLERVTGIAESVGLHYDFDALQHTNTVLAHQLLHYARSHGVQYEMKERLLSAYFVEGRHIGRTSDLADLAAEVGLDRGDVVRSLTSGEYLDAVHADQRQAQAYGIRGVPFFVIDGRLGLSGAQEPDTFVDALAQAAQGRLEADR
jgi:predicted DsbA family dithiol-disulfide isomerase